MVCLFSRADLAQGETRDASADVSVNHLACGKPGESAGECWVAALARRLQGRTSPLGPISMASPNICRHTFPQGMGDLEWKGPKGRAVLDAVVSNRRSGEKDRLDGNINWKICEILLSLCYTFSTWAMLPVAKSSTLAMWLLQLPQFGRAKTYVVTLAIKLPDVVHLLWLTEVVV